MGKKKTTDGPSMISWKPPTPQQRVKMAAEEFARVVAEASPQTQRLKERTLRAAMQASRAARPAKPEARTT